MTYSHSNLGFNTIEGELMQAMLKAELVNEEDTRKLQLLHFQRAARTDKGVSAVRQVDRCLFFLSKFPPTPFLN